MFVRGVRAGQFVYQWMVPGTEYTSSFSRSDHVHVKRLLNGTVSFAVGSANGQQPLNYTEEEWRAFTEGLTAGELTFGRLLYGVAEVPSGA